MIIVCEPQCDGFEHAEVNAALLAVVNKAFPAEEILFLAENKHLQYALKELKGHSIHNVVGKVIDIPSHGTINLSRLPVEMRIVKQVFDLAVENNSTKILFSSVTSAGLIAIKLLLKRYTGLRCFIIPHGILESIVKRPSILPWHFIFWFRFAMRYGHSDRITYVVLGASIEKRLCREIPAIKNSVRSITLPTFLKEPQNLPASNSTSIRFGTFGVAHHLKGSDLFFKMAEDVCRSKTITSPDFTLIGHIGDRKLKAIPTEFVRVPSPDIPLNRQEFDRYANEIDYSVYFYKPTSYQLTASGALFDAFSYVKPIIALRNSFFEYYFNEMGDIGYLCNDYEEVKRVVLDILNRNPSARYRQQIQNILVGRERFNLQNLGKQFKDVWEE